MDEQYASPSIGGLTQTSAAQGRATQVYTEIEELMKTAEELQATVVNLEQRLGSVMRSEDNQKEPSSPENSISTQVPLAGAIKELRIRILRQSRRIQLIMSRLEL